MIYPKGDKETQTQFEKDVKDQHLVYYYDAHNPETGEAEKWKYEMVSPAWVFLQMELSES